MNLNIFKKKTSPKEALRTSKREMSVATRGTRASLKRSLVVCNAMGYEDLDTSEASRKRE
ncbi:hypothetical protein ACJIZ3_008489 [Penstemon smallii]|uniref:Uncharacterized protein n=1 Tax=Penstemon smallii TaxID=265156 RepID=A0ABD3TAX4_9LAMI